MAKKKTTPTSSVLTPDMLRENKAHKQTMWLEFDGQAWKYRKLYVPETERGAVLGMLRSVDGEAYVLERSDYKPVRTKYREVGKVVINGKTYAAFAATTKAALYRGYFLSEGPTHDGYYLMKRDPKRDLKAEGEQ